jgi:hypothetical protein
MSTRRKWIETREDLIDFLRRQDGQVPDDPLDPWEIDDFSSVRHPDPLIEQYRIRVRDELIDLFASRDPVEREKIGPTIAQMISELRSHAQD